MGSGSVLSCPHPLCLGPGLPPEATEAGQQGSSCGLQGQVCQEEASFPTEAGGGGQSVLAPAPAGEQAQCAIHPSEKSQLGPHRQGRWGPVLERKGTPPGGQWGPPWGWTRGPAGGCRVFPTQVSERPERKPTSPLPPLGTSGHGCQGVRRDKQGQKQPGSRYGPTPMGPHSSPGMGFVWR